MFLSIKVVCKFLLVKSRISTFHQWLKNCCFADVDECSANSLLCRNGLCINMNGTYRCECNPGFQVSSDGKSCSRGLYATPVRTFLSTEISLTLKTWCQSRKWLSPREIHFTPFLNSSLVSQVSTRALNRVFVRTALVWTQEMASLVNVVADTHWRLTKEHAQVNTVHFIRLNHYCAVEERQHLFTCYHYRRILKDESREIPYHVKRKSM